MGLRILSVIKLLSNPSSATSTIIGWGIVTKETKSSMTSEEELEGNVNVTVLTAEVMRILLLLEKCSLLLSSHNQKFFLHTSLFLSSLLSEAANSRLTHSLCYMAQQQNCKRRKNEHEELRVDERQLIHLLSFLLGFILSCFLLRLRFLTLLRLLLLLFSFSFSFFLCLFLLLLWLVRNFCYTWM